MANSRPTQAAFVNIAASYLKIIFLPKLGVGPLFQVLDIRQYDCGLKVGSVLISTKNFYFEMACKSRAIERC